MITCRDRIDVRLCDAALSEKLQLTSAISHQRESVRKQQTVVRGEDESQSAVAGRSKSMPNSLASDMDCSFMGRKVHKCCYV